MSALHHSKKHARPRTPDDPDALPPALFGLLCQGLVIAGSTYRAVLVFASHHLHDHMGVKGWTSAAITPIQVLFDVVVSFSYALSS